MADLVGCELPRETWMVAAWVSALNGKTGLALHDGDTVPSANQSESDAEGVVEAVAKSAVHHFVLPPWFWCYPLVVVRRFLLEHGRSPFQLVQRTRVPVVGRIHWWAQVSFLQSLLVVQEGKGP